jgi:tetratricopeptide (TPR) repeat protein
VSKAARCNKGKEDCPGLRVLTFILAAILVALSSAGFLSNTVPSQNLRANRVLCRLALCNNAPFIWRAREQLSAVDEDDLRSALGTFRTVLQRDPHNPYRWADLGEAFLEVGQKDDARYCFQQVLDLAPGSAPLLLRAANYYLQIGQRREALLITASILALTPEYDSLIFSEYTRFIDQIDDVLQYGLPEDRRPAKAWLQALMVAERVDHAQRTWDWIASRGYSDDELTGEYVDFLVQQGHPDWAISAWTQYLGPRSGEYRKSNFLFNGDFESEPVQAPFDWKVARIPGVEVGRDCTIAWSGKCSFRISFDGTKNVDVAIASELAFVQPGIYRLQAYFRSENLTTDQGLRFKISDAEVPARLNLIFGEYTGTHAWASIHYDLTVPAQTRLLRIQVIRQASLKFDNKVAGTAWIDNVRLEPNSNTRPNSQ